jgi:hypothetical protein
LLLLLLQLLLKIEQGDSKSVLNHLTQSDVIFPLINFRFKDLFDFV